MQDAHNFVEAVKKIVQTPGRERAELQARIIKDYSDEVAKRGAEETQLSIKNGYMCMVSVVGQCPSLRQDGAFDRILRSYVDYRLTLGRHTRISKSPRTCGRD